MSSNVTQTRIAFDLTRRIIDDYINEQAQRVNADSSQTERACLAGMLTMQTHINQQLSQEENKLWPQQSTN